MHSAGHHEENLFLNELDLGSISRLLYLRFPPFCFPVGHLSAQSPHCFQLSERVGMYLCKISLHTGAQACAVR